MQTYLRRLQKTGRSTYIVSLPREWVLSAGLNKFDQLKIVPFSTGLLIMPKNGVSRSDAVIEVGGGETPDQIVRLFFSKYLDGFDRIKVTFPSYQPYTITVLKDRIRRWLVGVEIISETATELLAQVLPVADNFPIKSSIERMAILTHQMLKDACTALINYDKDLGDDVIRRDDEVDRFYHFVTRQLNIAVRDYSVLNSLQLNDPSECISYVLAAKSIERTADHAVNICKRVLHMEGRKKIDKKLVDINQTVANLFQESVDSLLNLDVGKANQVLSAAEQLESEIEALQTSPRKGEEVEDRMTVVVVLTSLKRISEYAGDVSEAAINIATKRG